MMLYGYFLRMQEKVSIWSVVSSLLLLSGILAFVTACLRINPKTPTKEPVATRNAPPDTPPYV
jgi:uncharacterized membrane protein